MTWKLKGHGPCVAQASVSGAIGWLNAVPRCIGHCYCPYHNGFSTAIPAFGISLLVLGLGRTGTVKCFT